MILCGDFETFYSKDYSLSKKDVTTESYIRDSRFEVIGISVKTDDREPEWFSGTKRQTKEWLEQFRWHEATFLAHHAHFDAAILNWHFGIRPKRVADTLSMGRALHGSEVGGSLKALAEHYGVGEKGDEVVRAMGKRRLDFSPAELEAYGEYCCNDTELTYQIFLKMIETGFPVEELRLIDLTIRMFSEPVLELDSVLLKEHLRDIKFKQKEALGELYRVCEGLGVL